MKLIKITTDNEISVHEFPEGNYSEQNEALADLITAYGRGTGTRL